jgi:hypothetical protein
MAGNQAVLRALAGRTPDPVSGGRAAPLPDDLRAATEHGAGVDLSATVVHHDSPRPAAFGAEAYAYGSDIHLAPGHEEHLPHEAWHVAQQAQGEVRATDTLGGVGVNLDAGLERAADDGRPVGGSPGSAGQPVLQGVFTGADLMRIRAMAPADRFAFISRLSEAEYQELLPAFQVLLSGPDEWHAITSARVAMYEAADADDPMAGDDDVPLTQPHAVVPGHDDADGDDRMDHDDGLVKPAHLGGQDQDAMDHDAAATLETEDAMDQDAAAEDAAPGPLWANAVEHVMLWMQPPVVDDPMDISTDVDDPSAVDVVMTDAWDTEMEITSVHAHVALEPDETGAYRRVHGTFQLGMAAAGWDGPPHVVSMDFDVAITGVSRTSAGRDAMELDITHGGVGEARWWRASALEDDDDEDDGDDAGIELPLSDDDDPMDGGLMADDVPDPLMDDLARDFDAMTITFRTDHGSDEERGKSHKVLARNPKTGELEATVESNPVAVKSILATGDWLGQKLPQATLSALTTFAVKANAAILKFAKSRTVGDGTKLKKALQDIATALEHTNLTAKLPPTDLTGSANYKGAGATLEGTTVHARPLSLNAGANVGSRPSGDSRLMDSIRTRANAKDPKQGKSYKQMHLLNDNVFGPGELWNLTPGTAASNSKMERVVEDPLKRAIIDRGLVLEFTANVVYKNDPMSATDADIRANPDLYRFKEIRFSATEWRDLAGTWTNVGAADADVNAINGAVVKWDYGNLRQLAPKAELKAGTSAADLEASGIPKAFSARIAAFLATGWKVAKVADAGAKKDQLETAMRAHEGAGARFGKAWDAWDANSVRW